MPFNAEPQVQRQVDPEEIVDQVLKTSQTQRILKKRQRNANNIPPLLKAYKHHMLRAKRIQKALAKMGCQAKDPTDSEDSGDSPHTVDFAVKFMKLQPQSDMDDH